MTAFVLSFSSDPDTAPHNSDETEQAKRSKKEVFTATGTAVQSLACA